MVRRVVEPDKSDRKLTRVCIDLTPVLPGGENGGAKVLALDLVRHLSSLGPELTFILLTAERSHEELAELDSSNVQRHCILNSRCLAPEWTALQRLTRLPTTVVKIPCGAYRIVAGDSLVRKLRADVLFCPFTAPFFWDFHIPVVSLVHDLQYIYYPQFFSSAERVERDRHFRGAARAAARVICVSEFVRQTVLQNTDLSPERISTIYSCPHFSLDEPSVSSARVLNRLDLTSGRFLIYPANFWPHKNHEVLLTAFGMYCAQHPASSLKLVLTGAAGPRMAYLQKACLQMNLATRVLFAGYLPDKDFAVLMRSCMAVIFPSLYEGFGLPVLEAMTAGKPVLCSNTTALPEIVGDGALLFDPRKPDEIVSAVTQLEDHPQLAEDLIAKGFKRAAAFGSPAEMASRYRHVFMEVVEDR